MGLLLFYEFCNLHNKVLLFPLSLFFLYLVSSSFPSLVQGGFLNLTLFQSSDGFLARLGCGVLFPSPYFLFVLLFFHFDQPFDVASSHKPKESWCNWEGKPYNWVGPLPSVDMVSSGSVYASPTHIPFRDNENFIAGNVQANCHKWRTILLNYSKADEIFRYVSLGVDIQEFFTPFKGTFQGRSYDSPIPPRIVFPNACNCQDHEGFISNCIIERVRNGSLLVVGKVGFVDPPHLVMPITIEPTKPRMCHDERFLNLWIKDCPFTLDYITDLPRYVGLNHFQSTIDDKSGYDHIPLHPSSCTFFGLQWKGYYFTYTTIPFGWKASAYI